MEYISGRRRAERRRSDARRVVALSRGAFLDSRGKGAASSVGSMRTIGFLYDRGSPFETPLAVQLARLCTLRVSTYEHVDKLARWLVRGAPPDILEPPAIPLVPHLRWRGGLQGPWLRWRMRSWRS